MHILESIRTSSFLPVIVISGFGKEKDRVVALEAGADDYMTKPFGVKELLARIQARLRRSETYSKAKPINDLELDPVTIDLKNAKAIHPDEENELTTREVELIRYLAAHANEPVSRDALLENVWRYEHSTNTRTVDVHI